MNPEHVYIAGMSALMVILVVLVGFLATNARAQEHGHPPQNQALHEKFYSTWNVPNGNAERSSSCCNKQDCEPAQTRFRNGKWEFRGERNPAWRVVPDALLEQNQSDPRESPDGQPHWCVYNGNILCATLGSGI